MVHPGRLLRALAVALAVSALAAACGRGRLAPRDAALPGALAYVRGGDVYLLEGGGPPRQLTDGGRALGPAWSADGQWLAFYQKESSGRASLWLAPRAGGSPAPVPGLEVPPLWTVYAWAPTGARLAAVAYRDRALTDLYVVEPGPGGAGAPRRVFTAPTGIRGFAWAPDGQRLAVVTGSNREGSPEPARIQVLDLAGGPSRVLLDWGALSRAVRGPLGAPGAPLVDLAGPTWSPDGRYIAFFALPATAEAQGGSRLFLLRADGGQVRPLAPVANYPQWVRWSPKGDRLAVVAGEGYPAAAGKQVLVYDPDRAGGPVATLTPAGQVDRDPAWAPDGTRLAVSRTAEGTGEAATAVAGRIVVEPGGQALASDPAAADVGPQFAAGGQGLLWLRVYREGQRAAAWWAPPGQDPWAVADPVDVPPGYLGELHTAAVLAWHSR